MVALLFAKDNKVEALEQGVRDFQAQQGQQGEYILEFEARQSWNKRETLHDPENVTQNFTQHKFSQI